MLGGTGLQSVGLYIFAILLPWYLCKGKMRDTRSLTPHFFKIGLGFIIIFSMFPIANLLALMVKQEHFISVSALASAPPFRKLLDSHFSSAILGTGVFYVIISAFLKFTQKKPRQLNFDKQDLFISFTKGTLVASSILGCYLLFQHYTGFDYKGAGFKLESTKRLVTSNSYRTLGFFSHPLSLAGGSLALFTFYWVLFCQTLAKSNLKDRSSSNPYLNIKLAKHYLLIACLHLSFIVLSGGRFAILLGLCTCVLYPFFLPLSKSYRLARRVFAALALSFTSILTIHSGVLYRFQELKVLWQHGKLDRFKFWQVHWQMILDSPLIGHGHAWLKHHKREIYYNHLGFENLVNKYNAHNLYLEILTNVGILGMMGILSGGLIILSSYGRMTEKTEHKVLYSALLIALISNLLNGMTNNSLFDSNIIYIYLFLSWVLTWNLLHSSSKNLTYQNSAVDNRL